MNIGFNCTVRNCRALLAIVACALVLGIPAPCASIAMAAPQGEEGAAPAATDDEHATTPDADHDEHDTHGDGHAEGHHEPPGLLSANPGAAIWNLLIFLAVLLVLGVFVWPQILAGLQARENKIHADLQGAETANREAQAALAGYQRQLNEAQDQVRQMLAEARRDAEQVGAKIVEEAKADAQRQRDRAVADIEAAKNVAIGELAGQTSDLAMSLARQVVGRELNAKDHADLIQQALDRMPSRN